MANENILSMPTIVEGDGWTLASGSADKPTEEQLKAALADDPLVEPEITPPAPPPRRPVVDEPPEEVEPLEEPAPGEEPIDEPPPAPRRRTHDPQRRIDQIHAQLASERERALRLESELNALRQAPPPVPPAVAPAPPPRPVWAGENGFEAQGKSWEEYEEARNQWTEADLDRRVEARFAQEREQSQKESLSARQEAAQRAAEQAFQQRVEAVRQKRPDYDTVIENLGSLDSPQLKELIYFSPEGPSIGLHLAEHVDQAQTLVDMRFTRPVMDALHQSNVPAQLLGYFAQHPAEAEAIMRMDPVVAIKTIGRLEARLDVDPSVTTAAASSVTRARPPLRTVGGGAPNVARTAASPTDDLEFSPDYVRQKNREEARAQEQRRGY